MKEIIIDQDGIFIKVELEDGGGTIFSDLHDPDSKDTPEDNQYEAMVDTIESMVLAHAVSGVDIQSKEYLEGLKTTLDAIANQ